MSGEFFAARAQDLRAPARLDLRETTARHGALATAVVPVTQHNRRSIERLGRPSARRVARPEKVSAPDDSLPHREA